MLFLANKPINKTIYTLQIWMFRHHNQILLFIINEYRRKRHK